MLITIGSITTAARAAKIIEQIPRISVSVVHTPKELNKGGCSYSIRFNDKYEASVRKIIAEYKIPARKSCRFFICIKQAENLMFSACLLCYLLLISHSALLSFESDLLLLQIHVPLHLHELLQSLHLNLISLSEKQSLQFHQ